MDRGQLTTLEAFAIFKLKRSQNQHASEYSLNREIHPDINGLLALSSATTIEGLHRVV